MTYLGERARDEVRGRARGTRRADSAQAATWRLRGIRVRSGRDRAGDRRHRGLERGGQHPAIRGGAGRRHLPAAQAAAVLTDFNQPSAHHQVLNRSDSQPRRLKISGRATALRVSASPTPITNRHGCRL
jgi:hypothetical protein